ncbi:MAG: pyridoxal phosphate-dependent aminotransferase [Leptospirales bacterium]|nr:pyridoxal phosphate-dependent aminotransferase [Leptospirales bacterium]
MKRRLANLDILELHSGNHDFASSFVPAGVLDQSFRAFSEHPGYRPDPRGYLQARVAVSNYYREDFGHVVSPDQIILTSGSSESYAWIFRLLTETGKETILAPRPSYPLFEHIADYARLNLVSEGSADLHAAALAVSPANPTGDILGRDQLEALAQRARAVIFDEVFSSYIWNAELSGSKFPRPRTELCFTLNGTSKLLATPWLKLSWILVEGEPSRVQDALLRLEFIADTFLTVGSIAQMALGDLLKSRTHWKPAYLDLMRRQRTRMLEAIDSIPGFYAKPPDGGFTIVVSYDKRVGLDEEEFAIRLLEETGVHVYPGYYFDLEGGQSFVVSFQQRPEQFDEALARLVDFASRFSR